MKNALRIGALLLALTAGGALAEDNQAAASPQQSKPVAERLDAQDRQAMIQRAKALDARIAQLQTEVSSLTHELAETPSYFDDPLSDPLRP